MSVNVQALHDAPLPEHARGMFDPPKLRQWVQEKAVEGFQTFLNRVESNDYRLRVKDVHIPKADERFTLKEQQDALLRRHDLTQPVRAAVELVHKKTGEVVARKDKVTLAHIPWVTDRNTVVYGGAEYMVNQQQRLKPGIYTRLKDTGETEAHVNVKPGTGVGGKVIFSPEKAEFVYQVGTTKVKLYGLLHHLGVSDQEMEQAWGKEIFARNKAGFQDNEAGKMFDKVLGRRYAWLHGPGGPNAPATVDSPEDGTPS
jgi:DNA-directed RNA polymerase beta subunit